MLESDYPEVRFYLLSPAAEILEVAERALPILELGRARDAEPRLRPVANEGVPWAKVRNGGMERSPAAAAAYLLGSALPLLVLLRISRRGRR